MFMTSLITRSTVDADLFPLLTIRTCISEAAESGNGPRFCAQDNLTGCAYEVRCVKLPLSRPSTKLARKDVAKLRKQQERIDALMAASASGQCPPCVAFPIDVYMQEQSSSGATYVAAVDAFAGLSLADIVRSGWRLVEEHVFLEILNSVEQFGCAAASLPPHGNFSADAIRQLLNVRDGAAEAEHRSRWVVGDWLLLHDDAKETFDPNGFLGDVEWVLQSAFSQLSIASALDGSFLSRTHVETVISETVERIRDHLLHARGAADTPNTGHDLQEAARKPSVNSNDEDCGPTGASSSMDVGSVLTVSQAVDARAVTGGTPALGSGNDVTTTPLYRDSRASRSWSRDVVDLVRDLSLRDKISYHQAELRKEQQLANKYRRRNAPLPPLPAPPPALGNRQDYEAAEAAEYSMQYLTSPIHPKPSLLLCEPSPVDNAPRTRTQSAPPTTRSSRKRAAAAAAAAKQRGESAPLEYFQPRQQVQGAHGDVARSPISRELLLENVISLALVTQQAKEQRLLKKREEGIMKRESLRLTLARSAAVEAHRQRRAASAHAKLSGSGGRGAVGGRPFTSPLTYATTRQAAQGVPTSSFPVQQQQKATSNRRRFTQQEQPLSARQRPQHSALTGTLGSATLIQVSNSTPSPAAEHRQNASRGTDFASNATPVIPPIVEPLPLASLLEARDKEPRQKVRQTAGERAAAPPHSVRASPRIPGPTANTAQRSPREVTSTAKAAPPTPRSPRVHQQPLHEQQQEKRSSRSVPQFTSRQPGLTSRRGSSASAAAAHPHAQSAHPHGLMAPVPPPGGVDGVRPTSRVQRGQGSSSLKAAQVIPPGRPANATTAAANELPTTTELRHVQMDSLRVTPMVVSTPAKGVVRAEKRPTSPRSPGRLQQTKQTTENETRSSPSTGTAQKHSGQRQVQKSLQSSKRKAQTPRAQRQTMKERTRSSSPLKKRDVHPVHEASIGITNRRARAGIQDPW